MEREVCHWIWRGITSLCRNSLTVRQQTAEYQDRHLERREADAGHEFHNHGHVFAILYPSSAHNRATPDSDLLSHSPLFRGSRLTAIVRLVLSLLLGMQKQQLL